MAYNYEYPYTDPGLYNDDWLINKVKQLAAEWEAMKVKFTTLEEYVKNYFANLNLQDEVNRKIEEMLANGALSSLIRQSTPYPPLFGKTLSIGGRFSAASVFNGSTVIGYFSYLASGNNVDLTSETAGLLHPDDTSYYNIIKKYLESHPDRYRYIFIMLDNEDIYYDNNSVWESALTNIFNLVYPYGAIPIVFQQPSHSRRIKKEDVIRYNHFYSVSQSGFYRPQVRLPFLICDGEIYSGEALSPGGVSIYCGIMFNACFPQFYSNIHNYDIIANSDGLVARCYNVHQDGNIFFIYLMVDITGEVRNFNFPAHVYNTRAVVVSTSGIESLNITNDICYISGTNHETYFGSFCIQISSS